MNKFYLIDKPINFTSFDVIRILRKKLNIRRMGHTGTLDPLATGGLLIAVGNYTKLIPYFEKNIKEYEFDISLDGTTSSFDLAEEIKFLTLTEQAKFKKELTKENIQKILNQNFKGIINQLPPKYSALKINGQKACDLMRAGKSVELKSREVEIFNIEIKGYNYPFLSLKASVSAGTYIRSIANDLGQLLGTGGYITKLRRTKVGILDISYSQVLDDFDESKSLDLKQVFKGRNFIKLDSDILEKMNNGLIVDGNFNYNIGEDLLVYNGDELTNILEYDGKKIFPKKKI